MRALGPGSVASLLKIALDCAYFVLLLAVAGVMVAAVAVPVALPFAAGSHQIILLEGRPQQVAEVLKRWPAVEVLLLSVGLYVAALVVIINRLRRVFETLTLGDPFRPENVGRLRVVGLSLIALEVVGYLVRMTTLWLAPAIAGEIRFSISLTGWFSILAVFVLAEVFREGARLRSDAELTI